MVHIEIRGQFSDTTTMPQHERVSICFQEVELKYNELRRAQGDSAAAADVGDSNGSLSVSDPTVD